MLQKTPVGWGVTLSFAICSSRVTYSSTKVFGYTHIHTSKSLRFLIAREAIYFSTKFERNNLYFERKSLLQKCKKDEKAYRVLLGLLKIVESSLKGAVERSFITHSDGEALNKVFSLVNILHWFYLMMRVL